MRKGVLYIVYFIQLLGLIAIDALSKQVIEDYVHMTGGSDIVWIPKVLVLHYLQNTGAAFSILKGNQIVFLVLTPILCVTICYAFIRIPIQKKYYPLQGCLVFLLAGAIGNYIDRLRFGYVRDFIYFMPIDFPVFNVADIYVTGSVIVLVILLLIVYKDEDLEGIYKRKARDE